jgi:hypothetical protein
MKNWCVYDTYYKEFYFFSSYDEAFEDFNDAVSVLETDAKDTATAYIFQVINKEDVEK